MWTSSKQMQVLFMLRGNFASQKQAKLDEEIP